MGRGARYWTGFVGCGVLVLAALVCLVAGGLQASGLTASDESYATARAQATVTSEPDRDDYLDVAFETEDGDRAASYLRWPYDSEPPAVGSTVRVAYDPYDPEWEVFVADEVDALPPPDPADTAQARTTALVGVALLVAALASCPVTVWWARRAPVAPSALPPYVPHPGFMPPYPYQGYPPPGHPYQGQPYQGYPPQGQPYQGYPAQGQPYQGQPYQGYPPQSQPYHGQPYHGQPYPGAYAPPPYQGPQQPPPLTPEPPREPEPPVSGFVVPPS